MIGVRKVGSLVFRGKVLKKVACPNLVDQIGLDIFPGVE